MGDLSSLSTHVFSPCAVISLALPVSPCIRVRAEQPIWSWMLCVGGGVWVCTFSENRVWLCTFFVGCVHFSMDVYKKAHFRRNAYKFGSCTHSAAPNQRCVYTIDPWCIHSHSTIRTPTNHAVYTHESDWVYQFGLWVYTEFPTSIHNQRPAVGTHSGLCIHSTTNRIFHRPSAISSKEPSP